MSRFSYQSFFWITFLFIPFLVFQNCSNFETVTGLQNVVLQSSGSGSIANNANQAVQYVDSLGQQWTHEYDANLDIINVTLTSSLLDRPTYTGTVGNILSGPSDRFCNFAIMNIDPAFGARQDHIVLACSDKNRTRIHITHQWREVGNSWSASEAHGLVCISGACPSSYKTLNFKRDANASNWSHFFTDEQGGSINAHSQRFNMALSPLYANHEFIGLQPGVNTTVDNHGIVYANQAPFFVNVSYNYSSFSNSVDVSHSATVNGAPSPLNPVAHGSADLN